MEKKERKESVKLLEESGGGLSETGPEPRGACGFHGPGYSLRLDLALPVLITLDSLCAYTGAESAVGVAAPFPHYQSPSWTCYQKVSKLVRSFSAV